MTPEKKVSRGSSISKALKGRNFPGNLEKLSQSVTKLWKDPEYRAKQANRTPSGKNTSWITNEIQNKRLKADQPLPEGWRRGKIRRRP